MMSNTAVLQHLQLTNSVEAKIARQLQVGFLEREPERGDEHLKQVTKRNSALHHPCPVFIKLNRIKIILKINQRFLLFREYRCILWSS